MKVKVEKHNPTREEKAHYGDGPVFFVVDKKRNILKTFACEKEALTFVDKYPFNL